MSWGSILKKVGKIAAITGASVVGSPALGAAVAGGLGALENRKKGLKGMLGGAALGAGTSLIPGVGGAAGGAANAGIKASAAALLKNPATYASILGGGGSATPPFVSPGQSGGRTPPFVDPGMSGSDKMGAFSDMLGTAGQVAGATSAGRAAGRAAESQLLDARDRTATDRYQAEQATQNQAAQTDLSRKTFSENARGSRAKQAAIADMLANFQPTNISTPGIAGSTISGGLSMGAGAKQAMSKLREQALLAQLKGDTPGGEDFQGGKILKPTAISGVPEETGYDKVLNATSGIGSMAGALGPAFQALMERKQYAMPQGPGAQPAALAGLQGLPGEDVGAPQVPPDIMAGLLANQRRIGQGTVL